MQYQGCVYLFFRRNKKKKKKSEPEGGSAPPKTAPPPHGMIYLFCILYLFNIAILFVKNHHMQQNLF